MLKYAPLLVVALAGCASLDTPKTHGTRLAKDGQVCRTYRETGSIMPGKRICHSEAEWQAIDRQQQIERNAMMGNSGRRTGAGGALN